MFSRRMPTAVPDMIYTEDGVRLCVNHWPVVSGPLQGVALIVHGLGEHILRYAHVVKYLNKRGWAVIGFDMRGHGRSQGPRGALRHNDSLLRDLAEMIDMIRTFYKCPLILVGHSLGGVLSARFAASFAVPMEDAPWRRPIDGLVMSSPALQISLNFFERLATQFLGRHAPDFVFKAGIKPSQICSDPETVRAYSDDPLVHGYMTARLLNFELDAGTYVRRWALGWTVPTLLMWAGKDSLVDTAGTEKFAAEAPRSVLTSRLFDSLSHEIFNEIERNEVLDTMGQWLAQTY